MFRIKFLLWCRRIYKRFTGGGFEHKHFCMCFDCVINEFPFWWHFPDISRSVRTLSLSLHTHAHTHICIYCFHLPRQIGYGLCGFVILVVFKANICTSSMFWMISKWKISQNPVNHQMMLFINKLGMGYVVAARWNSNVCRLYSWLWMQDALGTLENK
jgi:hypothetical protein